MAERLINPLLNIQNGKKYKEMIIINPYRFILFNLTDIKLKYDAGDPASYLGSGTTVNDISGNGLTATLGSAVTYDSANGGSFVFTSASSSNSFLKTVSTIPINWGTSNFTVSLWFNANNAALINQCVFSSEGGSDTPQFRLVLSEGFANKLMFIQKDASFLTPYPFRNTSTTINSTTWYNVVIVRTGLIYSFYLNGVFDGSTTATGNVNITGALLAPVTFGNRPDGTSLPFTGKIALPLIYIRGWSSDEVTSYYNSTKSRFGY